MVKISAYHVPLSFQRKNLTRTRLLKSSWFPFLRKLITIPETVIPYFFNISQKIWRKRDLRYEEFIKKGSNNNFKMTSSTQLIPFNLFHLSSMSTSHRNQPVDFYLMVTLVLNGLRKAISQRYSIYYY